MATNLDGFRSSLGVDLPDDILKEALGESADDVQGLIEAGNIDLKNRPRVKNDDGTVSTVRSMGINIDGKEVLIPTVSDDGRILDKRQAIEAFKSSGKHLGIFKDAKSSTAYAKQLHEDQANLISGDSDISKIKSDLGIDLPDDIIAEAAGIPVKHTQEEVTNKARTIESNRLMDSLVAINKPFKRAFEKYRPTRSALAGGAGLGRALADTVSAVPFVEKYLFGEEGKTSEVAHKASSFLNRAASEIMPDDPDFFDHLMSGVGSLVLFGATGSLAQRAALGAGGALVSQLPKYAKLGTKLARMIGTNTATLMEVLTESGGTYNDALEKFDGDTDKAEEAAKRTFLANAILIPLTQILGDEPSGRVRNFILKQASKEGIQEGFQTVTSHATLNYEMPWKQIWDTLSLKDVGLSTAIGSILGSGVGGIQVANKATLSEQNVDPGLLKRTAAVPGLPELAINKEYPVSNLRLVDALESSVEAAEQSAQEGAAPEEVALEAASTFNQEVEAAIETQKTETPQAKLADVDEVLNILGEQTDIESEIADKPKRIPRRAIPEVAKIAKELRIQEEGTVRAGLDPIWKEAQAVGLLPNSDTKEEFKGLDMSFKMGKKGVQKMPLDEFAASMVSQGIMEEGQGSNEALARLMKFKDRQRIPRLADVWDQAENIWREQNQKRRKGQKAAERVLAANKIEENVGFDLVDEIIVDKEAYEQGYGKEYSADDVEVKGATITSRRGALIQLASGATEFTGYHEAEHAVRNLIATEQEKRFLDRRFRDEAKGGKKSTEVEADAFASYMQGKSTGVGIIDRVFGKMAQFLKLLDGWAKSIGIKPRAGFKEALDAKTQEIFNKYGRIGTDGRVRAGPEGPQYSSELFDTERTTLEQRLKPHVEAAKRQGLNDRQALVYAKEKLAEAAKSNPKGQVSEKAKQGEFSAGGVKGFGQGEAELFDLQYSAEGKLKTDSKAFKDWFGESRVVDENGNPLVVYHGTAGVFEEFDNSKALEGQDKNKKGLFWFTDSPEVASDMAGFQSGEVLDRWTMRGFEKTQTGHSNVMPVYLSMQNPFIDKTGRYAMWGGQTKKGVQHLIEQGYDGIIFPNAKVDLPDTTLEGPVTGYYRNRFGQVFGDDVPYPSQYAVFSPAQIKSVFNRGTFDKDDDRIQFSAEPRQRAPIFFSQLDQIIQTKMQNKAGASEVMGLIRNAGVKQEEIEWSGIQEWLADKKTVTKQEVLDFIAQNQVQVKEVTKGAIKSGDVSEYVKKLESKGYTIEYAPHFETGEPIPDTITDKEGNDYDIWQSDPDNTPDVIKVIKQQFYNLFNEVNRTDTKFSSYQLLGGENYKEILLTLPTETTLPKGWRIKETDDGKFAIYTETGSHIGNWPSRESAEMSQRRHPDSPAFRSSHFDEPNILAHVRFNDRTINGKKVLFIEEVQSDWHQQGRDKGYKGTVSDEELDALMKKRNSIGSDLGNLLRKADYLGFDYLSDALHAIRTHDDWLERWDASVTPGLAEAGEAYRKASKDYLEAKDKTDGVPDAPFKKTWHELALKKMLRYAAENGYDSIAWTFGSQQVDRYEGALRQAADKILWVKTPKGVQITAFKGNAQVANTEYGENEVSDAIGKSMADRIRENPNQSGVFEGETIKISDTGMAGFYDRIIPSFLNKYTKKWGGRVSETKVPLEMSVDPTSGERFQADPNGGNSAHSLDITPSMRDSVIYVGQPLYSAEEKKNLNLPKKYTAAPKSSLKETLGEYRAKKSQDIKEFKDKILTVFSTRLANINPSIKRRMRQFEFDYRQAIAKDMKVANPAIDAAMKLRKTNPEHFEYLDLAMKNGDTATADKIADFYGIDLKPLRPMLNRIHERVKEVGFEVGYLPGYFPRMHRDKQGFLRFMEKQGEIWGEIEKAIREKEQEIGRYMNEDEKINLINSFIRGFVRSPITLSRTGNMKTREIEQVTPGLNQFYYNSFEALARYISEVNEAIETRRFFGRVEVKPDLSKEAQQELAGMSDAQKRQSALSFNNIQDSIGGYVNRLLENKHITPAQQAELTELLRDRFGYIPTSGSMGVYKNVTYMSTIANPISALSQLEDLGVAVYRSAWDAPGSFIRALANKSKIKLEDLNLEALNEEILETTKSAAALRSLLRMSGFTFMDRVGKETYINTTIDKFRSDVKEGDAVAEEKIVTIFGEESDQVIEDLKAGKTTEDILFLAFNELSETQPITLSEVPQAYLNSPGGRIFYALKTFMVKRLDFIRNEVMSGKTTPEKIKNFLKLYSILIVFGAGVDELKDFVLNRKTTWTDRTIDNLMKPFGISKYLLYKLRDEGPAKALIQFIAPPTKLVDSIWKDIHLAGQPIKVGNKTEPRDLEVTASLPLAGKSWYWWFGRGAQKTRAKVAEEKRKKFKR